MVSKLEDILLRCNKPGDIRDRLLNCLDDGSSLRQLRAVSRVLRDLVDHKPGRLFRHIYINVPLDKHDADEFLEILVPFCHSMTITVKPDADAPSRSSRLSGFSISGALSNGLNRINSKRESVWSPPSTWRSPDIRRSTRTTLARKSVPLAQLLPEQQTAPEDAMKVWINIFLRCHQLRLLTFRVYGDSAWPGRTEIEDMLVVLRMALEQAVVPNLREVRFAPLHAICIVHLRWSGLGAFGALSPTPSPNTTGPLIWQRLQTLDLQLFNPFATSKLTSAQELMFKKLLNNYLGSFAPTLRCLRFVWLDAAGPSPLTLHLEEELAGRSDRQALKWPVLEELRVGNMTHPHRTIGVAKELAPKLDRLWTLRTIYWTSKMELTDPNAWVEIFLNTPAPSLGNLARPRALPRPTSSMYSETARSSVTELGASTRATSGVIPFMLDFTGRRARASDGRRQYERGA